MGRVVVLSNPLDPSEKEEFDHSGPFIDWLLKHYPNGFVGEHLVSFNLKQLKVKDYDVEVGESDLVTLTVFPADPVLTPMFVGMGMSAFWAGVASSATSAVLMAGVSYGLNSMFGPKSARPKVADNVADNTAVSPSAVYSISGAMNQARVGQPIPVAYGTNLLVPDTASKPFVYYSDNEQFLVQLLCLGQGEFDVHTVTAAGSNVDSLPEVVNYEVYGPSRHHGLFGTIQNDFPERYENVYTSPEVSGQEIDNNRATVTGLVSMADTWTDQSDGITASWFYLDESAQPYADAIFNGTAVWATIGFGDLGQEVHRVEFIYHSNSGGKAVNDSPEIRFRKGFVYGNWAIDRRRVEIVLTFYHPPNPAANPLLTVGPFSACSASERTSMLQYDISLSGGLFKQQSYGSLGPFSITLLFLAYPVDDCGNTLGAPFPLTWSTTLATNTPQRITLNHSVPEGRYSVSATRTTIKSLRVSDASSAFWVGLKAVLGKRMGGQAAYGNVTLLSLKMKASSGLSSDAASRIRVCATRLTDDRSAALSNPADVVADIVTNKRYGGRRPASELDQDKLSSLKYGQWSGRTFDAVYDQATSVWDAVKTAVQMHHASPVTMGATLSLVLDEPKYVASAKLNQDQITSLSFTRKYRTDDYDGVEGEYIDASDNSVLYATYPVDAAYPEKIKLWGCKSGVAALAYVTRYWKQVNMRRDLLIIGTELDGRSFYPGMAVKITHPSLSKEKAVMAVISSVKPEGEVGCTIEAYVYKHEVFL